MSIYYARDGTPLEDVIAWGKLFENPEYKRVASTTLKDGKWVSTVWLGMDYNMFGEGPPLIFETMVFSADKEYNLLFNRSFRHELDCDRYSTEREALEGHAAMVKKWEEVIDVEVVNDEIKMLPSNESVDHTDDLL